MKLFPYYFSILFLISVVSTNIYCQEKYKIDDIKKEILPNADAVIRFSEKKYEVKSQTEVRIKLKHSVSVMNANGVKEGVIIIPYNSLTTVKSIRATIYDKNGKIIRKIKKNEFDDLSMINNFSLFEDDRMKRYIPQVNILPYTVEYECELLQKTTIFLTWWQPQNRWGLAIENSSCKLIIPSDFLVRMKTRGFEDKEVSPIVMDKKIEYVWNIGNLPALRDEPFSLPIDSLTSWVHIAPVNFRIGKMNGSLSSWEDYGKWCFDNLIKGNDKLPDATIFKIRQMVKGIDSPKEQARIIYEYAQKKNRYVSVQKRKTGGIHPMSAEEVDNLSYGDCKALCNYTRALLQSAGIKAYYCEVYAGNIPKSPPEDFVNATSTNHIILCVPFENDTVWLECTDDKIPFGYLGSFTGNRKALLCSEDGGKLVNTTTYKPKNNRMNSISEFVIDKEGTLTGNISIELMGTQYEKRELNFNGLTKNYIEMLQKHYNHFPEIQINSYSLTYNKEAIISTENMTITSPRFASISGNRLYIPINPVNPIQSLPRDFRSRTQNFYIAKGFFDFDSISYKIPDGYIIEYVPQNKIIETEFGSFSYKTSFEDDKIIVSRYFLLNDGYYDKSSYSQFFDFLKNIHDSDYSKIVLIK
ncbi:MAG: DUF3857 domain-containing protein [Marinilabiliaceae bacterium]|nr:DUF3857 domain-containing protein [Marinilabiliaceae bacterium]